MGVWEIIMAWSISRGIHGVCGNFKFEIFNLTDIKSTRSLIKPRMGQVHFVSSTNTTDNADVLGAGTLSWSGTADSNTVNKLVDASETFDPLINGAEAYNTTDNLISLVTYDKDATTALFCHKGGMDDATYDLAPDGNEVFLISSERIVQVTAVSADDDGTVLIIGR